jgi:hypothetical protein
MKRIYSLLAPVALVLVVGCGGSSSAPQQSAPAPASKLAYIDPSPSASQWSLVKDATSTDTHLVLNLVGPSNGTKYRGVGFTLQANPALVKFAQFKDTNGNPIGYYQDGGIFLDRNHAGTADVPATLQAGGVSKGNLMVGIFQKTDDEIWGSDQGATAKDCSGILLQVAVDFDATLKAMPGQLPISVVKARAVPEHVDTLLNRKTMDINLAVGTLTLK